MKTTPIIVFSFVPLFLMGCSTPRTMLRNEATGQVVTCGGSAVGSLAGGLIGYSIEKSNADECIASFVKEGFKPIQSESSKPE